MSVNDLYLGRYYDDTSGQSGDKILYDGQTHAWLFGPSGRGKGTRWLVPNLLSNSAISYVVVDPKGELCAITSPYRRTVGDVVILNPFNELGLGSDGFNPLASLDPTSPNFYDDCAALGEALIKIEGSDPHWGESAQGLLVALLMWVKLSYGPGASLEHVRKLLTEAERYESYVDENGKERERLVAGFRLTAADMAASRRLEVASLAGRFTNQTGEMSSVRSVGDTQTRWILSEPMRGDLKKSGVDFRRLKERPTTVYVILPAERMRTHSVWLRLVVTAALRALYRPGGLRTRFFIDELPALGHLGPLEDAFGLVRGYRVQIAGICQDLAQLKALYRERTESLVANAGIVQFLTPNDLTTSKWVSERAGVTTVVVPSHNERYTPHETEASEGVNWNQARRPLYLPQETMGFPEGTGLLFLSGMANGVRFFAPPFWKIAACAERARPSPYVSL